MTQQPYMTADEFTDFCIKVAKNAGYRLDKPMHPEDIATNLVPVMEAVAAGMAEAFRRTSAAARTTNNSDLSLALQLVDDDLSRYLDECDAAGVPAWDQIVATYQRIILVLKKAADA